MYFVENQHPFHSFLFSGYILFHTTSVLETFLVLQFNFDSGYKFPTD